MRSSIGPNRIHPNDPLRRVKLLKKLDKNTFYSPDGCHYWTGSVFLKPPRARISILGKWYVTARIIYELKKGPIGGLCVLHTCDNQMCINPDHIYLGTRQDNNMDKVLRNRCQRGERSGTAKLKEYQVKEILQSLEGHSTLGRKYKVTPQTIFNIRASKIWKHVKI